MIAYVDPDHVFEYVAPQLERLEARAHLFIITVRAGRAIAIDSFADGDHAAHDTDITELLPRLGCHGDFARWAAEPRVLTPTDVDLLCYALELEMPSDAPLPPRKPVTGTRAQNLLNAIYDEPDSDDVRLVYGDFLQEHDDPHGQLIALQIARAQRGGKPSAGERALVQWYGAAIAKPLAPHLRAGYELRRGFLAACAVDEQPPDEILASRAWATVESIETRRYRVLANPQLTAVRRAAIDTACLHRLVREREVQPFETLVGPPDEIFPDHTGLYVGDREAWRALGEIGPLGNLRSLALAITRAEPVMAGELLARPLAAQLDHLELHLDGAIATAQWRTWFDASALRRLVLRLWRGNDAHVAIALDRDHRLRFEVKTVRALRPHYFPEIFALLAELGRGIHRIEVALDGGAFVALRQGIVARFPEVIEVAPSPWWTL